MPLVCTPKSLPRHHLIAAAERAVAENPVNAPPAAGIMMALATPTREHLAMLTTKWWGAKGVHLTVGFLDNPSAELRWRLLAHLNAWGETANVRFVMGGQDPQVRIAREGGPTGGYWSYLGTDVLSIGAGHPTLNLEGFTMETPESEFRRVVRHEAGHTLGFPHEHMRRELVALIDPRKAIAYFAATQGWSAEEVRRQVLTPLEEASLWGTARADPNSVMAYQIPGALTISGEPILGGLDIDPSDAAFAALVYPQARR